jgi:uncharacterized membrane protein YcaP (DUF421 family)
VRDALRLGEPAFALAARAAVVYFVLLAGMRVSGKREVGQFTLFDLVFVLLVANAVQPAITGKDSSLLGGLVIVLALLALNYAVGWLRIRSALVRRIVEPTSTVIARDGRWIEDAMRKELITKDEGEAALREHGVASVERTELVVLEADGSLSVLPREDHDLPKPTPRRRRHVRFVRRG